MHISYGYCYLAGNWAEISRAKAGKSLLSRGRGDAAVGGEAALPGDQGLSLTCSATSGKLFSVLSWPLPGDLPLPWSWGAGAGLRSLIGKSGIIISAP